MKKLLAFVLVLALCLSLCTGLTACVQKETSSSSSSSADIEAALEYVKTLYRKPAEKTSRDFTRIGAVPVNGKTYEVVWSVDVAEEHVKVVKNADGSVTIDVNETSAEEVPYTLTATIKDGDKVVSFSWKHIVPKVNLDFGAIVDEAYALEQGASMDYQVTLTGVISGIPTPYDDGYKNITVTINVIGIDGKPIECYRLKGEGAESLKVGDTITVTGTLTNYQGKIQFGAGCTLDSVIPGEAVDAPKEVEQILKDAYGLAAGESTAYEATLTGKITKINTPYDSGYKNVSVTMEVEGYPEYPILCYRIKGEGADSLLIGDTITVKGNITNYNGTIEYAAGSALIKVEKTGTEVKAPSDPKQIIKEAFALAENESLPYKATLTGKITKVKTPYDDGFENVTVSMVIDGKTIDCYRLKGKGADKIGVGDTITVTGTLTNYKGTVQFASGCTLDDWKDTGTDYVPTVRPTAVKPETGKAYKFFIHQKNRNEYLYLTGEMAGYYYETTLNPDEAVDVYVEEVSGGYRMYFMKGKTKNYLEIAKSSDGAHNNVVFKTSPSKVLKWNDSIKSFTCDLNGEDFIWGTYSKYNTFSASPLSYVTGENASKMDVENFVARFGVLGEVEKESPAEQAFAQLKADYFTSEEVTNTTEDFTRKNKYTFDNTDVSVVWTVNTEAVTIEDNGDGTVTIKVTRGEEDVPYTLTATITDGNKTYTTSWECVAPAKPEGEDGAEITIEEALAIGSSMAHNTYTELKYKVTGVIKEVYKAEYGNMYIMDAEGNTLNIYGTYNADGTVKYKDMEVKPIAGDTVTIYGAIGNYNGPQIKNGWIVDHKVPETQLEVSFDLNYDDAGEAPASFKVNPNTAYGELPPAPTREGYTFEGWFLTKACDGEAVTASTEVTQSHTLYAKWTEKAVSTDPVAVKPEVGKAYKFFIHQKKLGQYLYMTGEMNQFYYATTTNADEAVDVYVEEVSGGYRVYFMKGETKTYLEMVKSGTHNNVIFTTEPTKTLKWNEDIMSFTCDIEDVDFYWGTYGTYNTFSASELTRVTGDNASAFDVSNFVAHFSAAGEGEEGGETPDPDPVMYEVTFDLNGAEGTAPATRQVEAGKAYDTLPTVEREGYTFGGWFKTEACDGEAVTASTEVTQSHTLYAKWVAIPGTKVKVNFDMNCDDAVETPDPLEVEVGSVYDNLPDPEREGYIFYGWYKDAECTGDFVRASDKVTGPHILYAKWKKVIVNCDISFNLNYEGAENNIEKITVEEGAAYGTLPTDPTREGYTFEGWALEDGTIVNASTTVSASHTLYAKWTENSSSEEEAVPTDYTITFDNTTKRADISTTKQIWQENGITVTNNKGSGNDINEKYYNPVRFYKNSNFVVECSGNLINKIVFNVASKDSTTSNLTGSLTAAGFTSTVNGRVVTVTFAEPIDKFELTCSTGKIFLDSITVTALVGGGSEGGSGSEGEGGETPDPTPDAPTLTTPAEIVDAAYALAENTDLAGTYTLTGKVTSVKTAYDSYYGNVSVIMTVEGKEDKPILCYRLSGTGADVIKAGYTITVTGSLTNFNGTIEFAQGCTLDSYVEGSLGTENMTPAEIVDAAYALATGETMLGNYTLTGKITSVDTPYSTEHKNVTVTIAVEGKEDKPIKCFRMKGTGADVIAIGDTITVSGILKNYQGTVEFDTGCTLDTYEKDDSAVVPPATGDHVEPKDVAYSKGSPSSSNYTKVVKNWGIRGDVATSLSPMATAFYTGTDTYVELAKLSGSSTLSSVPQSTLYTALQNLMVTKHSTITSYDDVRYLFAFTDCERADSTTLSLFYCGENVSSTWNGNTMNREHCWPKSKTTGSSGTTTVDADIMTLRPTKPSNNTTRDNDPYGTASGSFFPNTFANSKYDLRGDCARIVLYTYVRWGETNLTSVIDSVDLLLSWIAIDPVDTWELARNDSVESITGTRNVFVDYPQLAFLLFGEEVPANLTVPSAS